MTTRLPNMTVTAARLGRDLGPLWDGINPTLIARIYEVDHHGHKLHENGAVLSCLFVDDVNLEAQFNWQSPFENSGTGNLAPSMSAMLQSGMIQPLVESVRGMLSSDEREKFDKSTPGSWTGRAAGAVEHARGRTGITKLNSTQVFTGKAPIRIQATIMLRAWRDPKTEVEDAVDLLMDWVLPRHLAAEGTLLTAALDWAGSNNRTAESLVEAALPSEVPALLAIKYKNRTYAPMVIESIGLPLNSPSDKNGHFVQIQVPVVFSSLTAWDGASWEGSQSPSSHHGGLYGNVRGHHGVPRR